MKGIADPSPAGGNYVALENANGITAYISQTISLSIGTGYSISFYAKYRGTSNAVTGVDDLVTGLIVSVGGIALLNIAALPSTWTLYTTTFTATASSSVLLFQNNGVTSGDNVVFLDGVGVDILVTNGGFEQDYVADYVYEVPSGWSGTSGNGGDVLIAAADTAWPYQGNQLQNDDLDTGSRIDFNCRFYFIIIYIIVL